ncbi:MAG: DUF4870 domain-containing protein [Cyanobacteria bacterium P01_C01_bin.120]
MDDPSLSLYQTGSLALQQARYDDAIASLEKFCQQTINRRSKQFFQAQMWLIQAYHKDDKDLHAIALCEQLAKSDVPQVKQWANNALQKLMAAEPASSATNSSPAPRSVAQADSISPAATVDAPLPVPLPMDSSVSSSKSAVVTRRPAATVKSATSGHRPKASSQPPPKDYTQKIMIFAAHGSISMLASFLIFLLFGDSIFANGLGVLRLGVPLLIFFNTQDRLVKENAREALNYAITCLILLIPMVLAIVLLVFIFALLPPLGLLLGLVLGGFLIIFSVCPVVAAIACLSKEDYVFRYPDWLILHLI